MQGYPNLEWTWHWIAYLPESFIQITIYQPRRTQYPTRKVRTHVLISTAKETNIQACNLHSIVQFLSIFISIVSLLPGEKVSCSVSQSSQSNLLSSIEQKLLRKDASFDARRLWSLGYILGHKLSHWNRYFTEVPTVWISGHCHSADFEVNPKRVAGTISGTPVTWEDADDGDKV